MLYTEITISDKEYKAKLTTRAIAAIEKSLGENPLNMFVRAENGELPKVSDIAVILHAALQKYHHNVSIGDTYEIIDDYIDDGNSYMDLVSLLTTVFQDSGFLGGNSEDEPKN